MVTFLLQEHFLKRKCILLADLEVRRILFQARLEWWEGQQGGQRTGEAGQRLRAGPAATPSLEAGMLPRVRGGGGGCASGGGSTGRESWGEPSPLWSQASPLPL